MNRTRIAKALEQLLGPERVLRDPERLAPYAQDMTENEPAQPDFVVKPVTVEEVQALVQLANKERVPLTPVVARTNLGGLGIPVEGGIVVDLTEMNRLLAVDPDAMYALLEPGVTYAQLRQHLDQHYPDLLTGYPLSPPSSSVLCNCLLDGLVNLSFRHGSTSRWLNGLEAVLPSGEVVRTGAAALRFGRGGETWFGRGPLPDLTGLFISWQGTTGIVTKGAVQLWPTPPHRRRLFFLAHAQEQAFQLLRQLARTQACDDLGGTSWPLSKLLFGIDRPLEKDPDEPEFFIYLDYSAQTSAELAAKEDLIFSLANSAKKRGTILDGPLDLSLLTQAHPALKRFADFPMTLDFLLDHPGKGLTWVGCYGPTANWAEGGRQGQAILERHRLPPMLVVRAMEGGHYGVLRFITTFHQADPGQVALVRQVNSELCDALLDLGFIPYKAPAWAVRKMLERLDPGFVALLRQIKETLDPRRIMNPGRWLL
ncbi:MAG: FAD-binding oxidoreductase [Deinococcus sp.]|nr:FAD-binding oxidoreductase [Deinococcus sp.]